MPGVVQPRQYIPVKNDDKPFDPTWLLDIGTAQIIFGIQHFASKLRGLYGVVMLGQRHRRDRDLFGVRIGMDFH